MIKEQVEAIVYDIKHDSDENDTCALIFKDGTHISGKQYAIYLRDNFVEYYDRSHKIKNIYYCDYDKIIGIKEIGDPNENARTVRVFDSGELLLETDGRFSLETGAFLSLITWREI